MKKCLLLTVVLLAGLSEATYAANLAVTAQPPTILNLLVFVAACVALFVSARVLGAVKGGHLSKSWQLFVVGFAILALCQVAVLLQVFEIIALPVWAAPALLVGSVGVLLYGLYEAKRILG